MERKDARNGTSPELTSLFIQPVLIVFWKTRVHSSDSCGSWIHKRQFAARRDAKILLRGSWHGCSTAHSEVRLILFSEKEALPIKLQQY
jgi:hypothetical protein